MLYVKADGSSFKILTFVFNKFLSCRNIITNEVTLTNKFSILFDKSYIENTLSNLGSIVFKDLLFSSFKRHVSKIYSQGYFEGVILEISCIMSNNLKYFLVRIDRRMYAILLIIILILVKIGSILFLIKIVIIILIKLILKDSSLKLLFLITGRLFWLPIRIIVVVILIVPSTKLVEHVNILGVLYFEPFSIRQLSKYFESLRIGIVVAFHLLIKI